MSEKKITNDAAEQENMAPSAAATRHAAGKETKKTTASRLLETLGVKGVTDKQLEELEGFIGGLDFKSSPEDDPAVMNAVVKKLIEMGFVKGDIHDKSLVAITEADKAGAEINRLITGAKEPTENYPSNVGVYHFTVGEVGGKRAYMRTGLNGITAWTETILRKSGDLGGNVFSNLFTPALRRKANIEEVGANIKKLGLEAYFKKDNDSVLEDIEDIRSGAVLDDLLRLREEHPFLKTLDPQEGLVAAAKMVASVHKESGSGIGDLLANDIVLQVKDGKIAGARLTLPDMTYSEDVPALEQKATDLLDFCFSTASAGLQTGGEAQAKSNIGAILQNYADREVKEKMIGLIGEGRLHFTFHNKVRLGYDRVEEAEFTFNRVREIIREELTSQMVPMLKG